MQKTFLLIIFLFVNLFSQDINTYYKAVEAFRNKNYPLSQRLFEEVLKDKNTDLHIYTDAKFYYSESFYYSNRIEEAFLNYKYFVDNYKWSLFRYKALYRLGSISYHREDYKNTRLYYEQLIKEYPENEYLAEVYYSIGDTYLKEENIAPAIEYFEKCLTIKTNNRFITESVYALGFSYEISEDFDNAISYYDQVLVKYKEHPLSVQAQIRIGVCYFKLKDYQTSILELKHPNLGNLPKEKYAESLYYLAISYYRVGEYNNAEATFKEIIKNFPINNILEDVKIGLAFTLFQKKSYQDAYNILNSISQENSEFSIYSIYWSGIIKKYEGNLEEANRIFTNFIKQNPISKLKENVYLQLGLITFEMDNYTKAAEYLNLVSQSKTAVIKAKANLLLGEMNLVGKNYTDAKVNFNIVKEIKNIDNDIYYRSLLGIAQAEFYLKNNSDALNILTEIQKNAPDFEKVKVLYLLGESYYSLGRFNDALTTLALIEKVDSVFYKEALYTRGYACYNLSNYNEALDYFKEFTDNYTKDQKNTDALLRLADCYYATNNFSFSAAIYNNLISSNYTLLSNPDIRFRYAQILYKAKNYDKAIEEFQNFENQFPKSYLTPNAGFSVGLLYYEKGDYSGSITYLNYVLQKYYNSNVIPQTLLAMAQVYYSQGNYDSSITYYRRIVEEHPSSEYLIDAVTGVQKSYISLGRKAEAITVIDELIVNNPSLKNIDELLYKKGEAYYNYKSYNEMRKTFDQLITSYPQSHKLPDAYYLLAKSNVNINKKEEALKHYKTLIENYPQKEVAIKGSIEAGDLLRSLKRYQEELRLYTLVLNHKTPENSIFAKLLYLRATSLVETNQISEAIDDYVEVIQDYPGSEQADYAKMELGLIEIATSRYDFALQYFTHLSEKRTDELGAKAQYYEAYTYYELKQYEEALASLERSKEKFPLFENWRVRGMLKEAEIYTAQKLIDKAKEIYSKIIAKHPKDEYGKEARTKLRQLR